MKSLRLCVLLTLVAALLTGCQLVLEAPETTETALAENTIVALETLITEGMTEIGVPGMTLAIVMDGEPVYLKGFGVAEQDGEDPVTPETVFHLASIAKTVTGSAIMQLVEEGQIDLDSPLTAYLPDFAMADPRYADMTIRQLLSHTAGMPDVHDWVAEFTEFRRDDEMALADLTSSWSAESLLFTPGEDWDYSNVGFDLLGHVIAEESGQSYEAYVDEHIFSPLGMENTAFFYEEIDPELLASPHVLDENEETAVSPFYPYNRSHSPATTLISNSEDMARYMAAHLNRGELDGERILTPESYDESWKTQGETYFGPPEDPLERYYGLGWTLGEYAGQPIYSHVGGDPGFNSFMALAPEQSTGVFIAANRGNMDPFDFPVFMLRMQILELLLEEQAER